MKDLWNCNENAFPRHMGMAYSGIRWTNNFYMLIYGAITVACNYLTVSRVTPSFVERNENHRHLQ